MVVSFFFPGATCGVWWAWAIRGQGRGGYLWFISGHNSRKGASCWYSKSVAHIVSVTLPLNRQLCWHTLPCRSAWLPASTVCGHREREREPRGFSKQLRSAQTHTHTHLTRFPSIDLGLCYQQDQIHPFTGLTGANLQQHQRSLSSLKVAFSDLTRVNKTWRDSDGQKAGFTRAHNAYWKVTSTRLHSAVGTADKRRVAQVEYILLRMYSL